MFSSTNKESINLRQPQEILAFIPTEKDIDKKTKTMKDNPKVLVTNVSLN